MKPFASLLGILSVSATVTTAADTYTNFIRQVQLPSDTPYDVDVASTGERQSELAINPNGARFELWTIKSSPLTEYLLDTQYVGAFVPVAEVTISTPDSSYSTIPRTRADQPITVTVEVSGLLSGDVPDSTKSVIYQQYVQTYGEDGTGQNIDREGVEPVVTETLTTNGTHTFTIDPATVPNSRGEIRVVVSAQPDSDSSEPSQLSSQFVQVWPVAEAKLEGLTDGQKIEFALPDASITLNDLYPESSVYLQVYDGPPKLGTTGTIVPGSQIEVKNTVPEDHVINLSNWTSVFNTPSSSEDGNLTSKDGQKTFEVVTVTPFGTERLAVASPDWDGTIQINSGITTSE